MSGVSNTERLRALIQAVLDQGETYGSISTRSGIPKSSVALIATREHRAHRLPDSRLRELAVGLRVPFPRVLEAARRDAGEGDVEFLTDEEVLPGVVLLTETVKGVDESRRDEYVAMAIELSKAYRT